MRLVFKLRTFCYSATLMENLYGLVSVDKKMIIVLIALLLMHLMGRKS